MVSQWNIILLVHVGLLPIAPPGWMTSQLPKFTLPFVYHRSWFIALPLTLTAETRQTIGCRVGEIRHQLQSWGSNAIIEHDHRVDNPDGSGSIHQFILLKWKKTSNATVLMHCIERKLKPKKQSARAKRQRRFF